MYLPILLLLCFSVCSTKFEKVVEKETANTNHLYVKYNGWNNSTCQEEDPCDIPKAVEKVKDGNINIIHFNDGEYHLNWNDPLCLTCGKQPLVVEFRKLNGRVVFLPQKQTQQLLQTEYNENVDTDTSSYFNIEFPVTIIFRGIDFVNLDKHLFIEQGSSSSSDFKSLEFYSSNVNNIQHSVAKGSLSSFSKIIIDDVTCLNSTRPFHFTYRQTATKIGFIISNSRFEQNEQVPVRISLEGKNITLKVTNTSFLSNRNYDKNSTEKIEDNLGGGLFIYVRCDRKTEFDNLAVQVQIESCIFNDNLANIGGGLYIKTDAKLIADIIDTHFEENMAYLGGGASFFKSDYSNAEITVEESRFFGNHGQGHGGAMYIGYTNGDILFNMSHTKLHDNSVLGTGGGIRLYSASGEINAHVDSCIFTNQTSLMFGGAMFFESSLSSFNGVFTNNEFMGSRSTHGASIYITAEEHSKVVISNNKFDECEVETGNIYVVSGWSDLDVVDSHFLNLIAEDSGAAIYTFTSLDLKVSIKSSYFKGNIGGDEAKGDPGGVIYFMGYNIHSEIVDCTMTFNYNPILVKLDSLTPYPSYITLKNVTMKDNRGQLDFRKVNTVNIEDSRFYNTPMEEKEDDILPFIIVSDCWFMYAKRSSFINYQRTFLFERINRDIEKSPFIKYREGGVFFDDVIIKHSSLSFEQCYVFDVVGSTFDSISFENMGEIEGVNFTDTTISNGLRPITFDGYHCSVSFSRVTYVNSFGIIATTLRYFGVDHSTFSGNTNSYGGSLWIKRGVTIVTLLGNKFEKCTSTYDGGAIYLEIDSNSHIQEIIIDENNIITHNRAGRNGGGMAINVFSLMDNVLQPFFFSIFAKNEINYITEGEGGGGGLYISHPQKKVPKSLDIFSVSKNDRVKNVGRNDDPEYTSDPVAFKSLKTNIKIVCVRKEEREEEKVEEVVECSTERKTEFNCTSVSSPIQFIDYENKIISFSKFSYEILYSINATAINSTFGDYEINQISVKKDKIDINSWKINFGMEIDQTQENIIFGPKIYPGEFSIEGLKGIIDVSIQLKQPTHPLRAPDIVIIIICITLGSVLALLFILIGGMCIFIVLSMKKSSKLKLKEEGYEKIIQEGMVSGNNSGNNLNIPTPEDLGNIN